MFDLAQQDLLHVGLARKGLVTPHWVFSPQKSIFINRSILIIPVVFSRILRTPPEWWQLAISRLELALGLSDHGSLDTDDGRNADARGIQSAI